MFISHDTTYHYSVETLNLFDESNHPIEFNRGKPKIVIIALVQLQEIKYLDWLEKLDQNQIRFME